MAAKRKYKLVISTSVLEDLGLKLYSSVPAVLSEIVANAWDADAPSVEISFNAKSKSISIRDHGTGMSSHDLQTKYLEVGYKRRQHGEEKTVSGRKVMGRKGIGKLAPLAIADEVTVVTHDGKKQCAIRLTLEGIRKAIDEGKEYFPDVVTDAKNLESKGTLIQLNNVRKGLAMTEDHLRRRISRRFTTIGAKFKVFVNGGEITPEDRGYLDKAQFLWTYGTHKTTNFKSTYKQIKKVFRRDAKAGSFVVSGWIATVSEPKQLKEDTESLNKIVIMSRGKLVHEDVLGLVHEARVYATYVVGELHAEFLDVDNRDDIATTNRQGLIEDDLRFQKLMKFLRAELVHIKTQWGTERDKVGAEEAAAIPALAKWIEGLAETEKKSARSLLGKVSRLPIERAARTQLYKYCVLAFESLRVQDNLNKIRKVDPEVLQTIGPLFVSLDDVEAAHYHQITKQRLAVIQKFVGNLDDDVLECVLRDHVADHLWILDHSWDKISELPTVEKDMHTLVEGLKKTGDAKWKKGRIDIRYSKTTGQHIIIELKRYSAKPSIGKIIDQVRKYHGSARRQLDKAGRHNESVEVVVLLGEYPESPAERPKMEDNLRTHNARVLLYRELADNAEKSYKDYLKVSKERAKIAEVLDTIKTLPDDI